MFEDSLAIHWYDVDVDERNSGIAFCKATQREHGAKEAAAEPPFAHISPVLTALPELYFAVSASFTVFEDLCRVGSPTPDPVSYSARLAS